MKGRAVVIILDPQSSEKHQNTIFQKVSGFLDRENLDYSSIKTDTIEKVTRRRSVLNRVFRFFKRGH